MNAPWLSFAVVLGLGVGAGVNAQQADTRAPVPPRLRLRSTFAEATAIPNVYTCMAEGAMGMSPPLNWFNVPKDTRSFAITLTNMDNHPGRGLDDESFWMAWNIPGSATQLAAGVPNGGVLPDGMRQATLGRTIGYRPPCPPPGTGPLHYVFTLYALDQTLDVPGGAARAEVTRAMDGHILGSTILLGYFER
jgi:Raf kinase inhibitor-like YbhB/YbcL family protein